jgi:hypothetical protein
MQMRWGRHGVKSARWVLRSNCAIGGPIGAIAFDAQGNVLNVDPRRTERARRQG